MYAFCEHLEEDTIRETERMLNFNNPPDAIFCFNDPVAITCMQFLKERGIKIPEDISIIGFTNEPIAALVEPSLTTVSQPAYEMGKAATKLIIDQIESKEDIKEEVKILKTSLIIRNSTRKLKA
jgi:LacI family transcriptional regulator